LDEPLGVAEGLLETASLNEAMESVSRVTDQQISYRKVKTVTTF